MFSNILFSVADSSQLGALVNSVTGAPTILDNDWCRLQAGVDEFELNCIPLKSSVVCHRLYLDWGIGDNCFSALSSGAFQSQSE
jgi:hypothetical protein